MEGFCLLREAEEVVAKLPSALRLRLSRVWASLAVAVSFPRRLEQLQELFPSLAVADLDPGFESEMPVMSLLQLVWVV